MDSNKKRDEMRKSRLILAPAALLAASALVLSGCAATEDGSSTTDSGTTDNSSDADSGEEYEVFVLLPAGADSPYTSTYIPAMQAKADELGINLTITNSEFDADKQASECEIAVAANPDGLVFWPAVGDTVRGCLEAADAAGVPVWITNTDLNEEDRPLSYGYSGPDTYGQGVASGELMCDFAAGDEIGIIQVNGEPGNGTAIDRDNGFTDHVNENCPNVSILAEQPGNWLKAPSQTATSEMLSAVGIENVQGIYAADDTMVSGAIEALESRGENASDYVITSIGNTFLGNPLVREGKLDGTVFQSSSWDGDAAMQGIYDVITGKTTKDERVVLFMPQAKVTAENADDPAVAPEW